MGDDDAAHQKIVSFLSLAPGFSGWTAKVAKAGRVQAGERARRALQAIHCATLLPASARLAPSPSRSTRTRMDRRRLLDGEAVVSVSLRTCASPRAHEHSRYE